jgi:F0F1-type ATP synthase assembly protein I
MKSLEKNTDRDERIKKIIRKQYLVAILVSRATTRIAVGAGYLIDQWQGTQPIYMLVCLVISGPLAVWFNYGMIKRKLIALNKEIEKPIVEIKP